MSNLHQQWVALIKETRSWIEQKWEEGCRFTYAAPIKLKKEPPKPSPQPKPTPPPFYKPEISKIKWELNPMPLPEAADSLCDFFRSSFKGTKLTGPLIPIVLLLPEDRPAHRLFFENVARAITYKVAAARVIIAKAIPFKDPSIKLIIAPYSLMQKSYPDLQTHHFYPTKGLTLLPIEEVESYLEDLNLKRTLWNTLKTWHFPNTLRSSST